jgi:hypothetical protein
MPAEVTGSIPSEVRCRTVYVQLAGVPGPHAGVDASIEHFELPGFGVGTPRRRRVQPSRQHMQRVERQDIMEKLTHSEGTVEIEELGGGHRRVTLHPTRPPMCRDASSRCVIQCP